MGDRLGYTLERLPRGKLISMLKKATAERDKLSGRVRSLEEDLERHKAAYRDLQEFVGRIPVDTVGCP